MSSLPYKRSACAGKGVASRVYTIVESIRSSRKVIGLLVSDKLLLRATWSFLLSTFPCDPRITSRISRNGSSAQLALV